MDNYERSFQKKREIENALLELMLQLPYSQINVTRLTEHLGISRKSFYHYFPNMNACLEALVDRMIVDAAIHVTTANTGSGEHFQRCVHNLEYWKQHAFFLNVIVQNQLDDILTDRYLLHLMSEGRHVHTLMQTEEVAVDEDVLFFFTCSIVRLLLRWCRRGFDTPVEALAEKLHRLLRKPLLQEEEA